MPVLSIDKQSNTHVNICDVMLVFIQNRLKNRLLNFAIDPACIDHYARTVSEWSKDNTVSFGLRDMIRRFRDCLGR